MRAHHRGAVRPLSAAGRARVGPLIAAVVALGIAIRAGATAIVPMPLEALVKSADAVVLARVEAVRGFERADGRIGTRVDLRVDAWLAGAAPMERCTLEELGGRVGDRIEVVFAAPQYSEGEAVAVFLHQRRDGRWATSQLGLGKFDLVAGEDGATWAVRRLPGSAIRPSQASDHVETWPLDELIDRIAGWRADAVLPGTLSLPSFPSPRRGARLDAAFRLFENPARFFEPDTGEPLRLRIDQRGDDTLGVEASRRAAADGFAAWSEVAGASVVLEDGGLTADLGTNCEAGNHLVRFNDPQDEIQEPKNCTGVLAVGGFCSTTAEKKTFNGQTFSRALRALVTFADGWGACPQWVECNVAEVATHEVGHAIGFAHSSEDFDETDPVLADATMYFRARFDGRCAALRQDDIAGAEFLYPIAAPPSIVTTQLPEAVTNRAYRHQLEAVGGSGGFTWSEAPGGCQGFPGLTLQADGAIAGTPTAFGSGCFDAVATDSSGNSHQKRLDLAVALTASTPTATPSPTSTFLPPPATPSATVTRSPTRPVGTITPPATTCPGDCDGNHMVAINELILAVNIALGSAPPEACLAANRDGDQSVSVSELIAAVAASLNGCP